MAYSLTNTTKKSSGSSSSSSNNKSITVTRSQREENRNGSSSSGGSVSSGGSKYSSGSTNTLSGANTSGIKYDPNKDYAAAIQNAVQSGASQSYINQLNAERNAKIKGENLSYSELTDSDIASYRNYGSIGGRKEYDSASVIGGMENGNYGIRNPFSKDYSNFNSDVDFDARIEEAKKYGYGQDTINALTQMKEYSEKVRNGEINPYGYGEGLGYNNRKTTFVFTLKDGTKVPVNSNATRYEDAARLAGINPDDIQNTSALTYGTASSSYSKPGYGFGTINGANDFTTNLYADQEPDRLYDMNNMQLQFLSGRDGKDYYNPYAGYSYTGNGMNNAYNAGTQFAGQGGIMGGYGVEGPNMDDIYANYGSNGYVGLTKDDIQSQFDDIYSQYQDAIDERNSALAASYNQQRRDLEGMSEEQQRANYINYKLAGLNMPAQLQAAGINGGVAESTLAGLESDYMTNYNSTANALTDAVNQLEIAKNNAIADGNLEAANMYSQLAQNSLSLQMQAAQAQNAYNQWVQEMAFARTQWEYEQARYQAELAYQQQQDAENRSFEWMKQMADMGLSIGDSSYLQGLGFDTTYFDKYQNAQLQGLLLDNQKKSSSLSKSRSSGGSSSSSKYSDSIDNLLDGTTYNSTIDQYISDAIRRNGTGAMYVPGFDYPLTESNIKSGLSSGQILADITNGKVTLGSPEYINALNNR